MFFMCVCVASVLVLKLPRFTHPPNASLGCATVASVKVCFNSALLSSEKSFTKLSNFCCCVCEGCDLSFFKYIVINCNLYLTFHVFIMTDFDPTAQPLAFF